VRVQQLALSFAANQDREAIFEHLSFLTAYTFGKSIDETSQASLGFASGGGPQSIHPSGKRPDPISISGTFVNSFSYDIPFGKGKRFGGNEPAG